MAKGDFKKWRVQAASKDWLAMVGVIVGLLIVLLALYLGFRVWDNQSNQNDALRRRAVTAEQRQARSEGRADLAERRLDETLEVARKEREFYRQLECEDIQTVNRFITVVSRLIVEQGEILTPEQRELFNDFIIERDPPPDCE